MCGIAGYIDFSKAIPSITINKMIEPLKHRGPDGKSSKIFNTDNCTIALGHTRLSIIDLSDKASQPMQYKNYCITFNGEVYNYKEIKEELISKRHSFITDSDTEVILHAFEEWGDSAVNKFIGMFAFVIFDELNHVIYCYRDRVGVKPFYYFVTNEFFVFASELKSFHQFPNFKPEINTDALANYFVHGSVPYNQCIFNSCFKLLPGNYLKYNLTTKQIITKQYWTIIDAYNKPKLNINYNDAIAETTKQLGKAANYRMVADVKVGVFLSGGYDSASLTALLQKNNNQQINTFTIGVPHFGLNEAPFAKKIAQHLQTNHTEYDCTENEALALIESLPYYYDEPFADSSAIPTLLVSQLAKKSVTVALSADGGDELFAGYNRYSFVNNQGKKLKKIPAFIKKGAVASMNKVNPNKIPILKNTYNFIDRFHKLKYLLQNHSDEILLKRLTEVFSVDDVNRLVNFPFTINYSGYHHLINNSNYTTLNYMLATDFVSYLPNDILHKVDRASMSVSLEAREPYLDHQLAEWCAQLPDEYKLYNKTKKRILKDITHQLIPKQLMDRPKMGFAIPVANWLQNQLKTTLNNYINEDNLNQMPFLNKHYVLSLKSDFLNGKTWLATRLWHILMFIMWYKKWMK
ncbi:MAG: asparagine synthase (glutamine-hydrolyzing) [Bacteroidetes bacterium]|nr:asparagine synthase (glutamine-hydrolyzing) [Bacteroidota bacterium]